MSRELVDAAGRKVLCCGLTGGIATGKSTVGGMLRELGVFVLDADEIVFGLLAPGGEAVPPVVEAFGEEVRAPGGGIDRPRLAARVFDDEDSRRRLEAIVHPLVLARSAERLEEAARAEGGLPYLIYDAALLVETGRHEDFDRLIVVAAPLETQIERLRQRDGLDEDQAMARIRSQLSLERKIAVADHVIDNGGSWRDTRRQVLALHADLLEAAARERGARR